VRRDSVTALPAGALYDAGPDGSVLFVDPVPWANQVIVKTNWLPELRARLR